MTKKISFLFLFLFFTIKNLFGVIVINENKHENSIIVKSNSLIRDLYLVKDNQRKLFTRVNLNEWRLNALDQMNNQTELLVHFETNHSQRYKLFLTRKEMKRENKQLKNQIIISPQLGYLQNNKNKDMIWGLNLETEIKKINFGTDINFYQASERDRNDLNTKKDLLLQSYIEKNVYKFGDLNFLLGIGMSKNTFIHSFSPHVNIGTFIDIKKYQIKSKVKLEIGKNLVFKLNFFDSLPTLKFSKKSSKLKQSKWHTIVNQNKFYLKEKIISNSIIPKQHWSYNGMNELLRYNLIPSSFKQKNKFNFNAFLSEEEANYFLNGLSEILKTSSILVINTSISEISNHSKLNFCLKNEELDIIHDKEVRIRQVGQYIETIDLNSIAALTPSKLTIIVKKDLQELETKEIAVKSYNFDDEKLKTKSPYLPEKGPQRLNRLDFVMALANLIPGDVFENIPAEFYSSYNDIRNLDEKKRKLLARFAYYTENHQSLPKRLNPDKIISKAEAIIFVSRFLKSQESFAKKSSQ